MEKDRDFEGSGGGGGSRTPTRTPDNLLSQDYVELKIGLCVGPIAGLKGPSNPVLPHGPLENYFFGNTAVQNIADGKANFTDFKITEYRGAQDDPEVESVLGGDSSNQSVGVSLGQSIPVIRTTSSALRKTDDVPGINRLEVRILFNTIVKQTDDGTFNFTAHLRISYKPSLSTTWIDYKGASDTAITGKTTGGYLKDFLIDVEPLENDDYDVRVIKLSPDNGTQEIVEMTWDSIQSVTLAKPRYPGLAFMHVYGKVTDQFSSLPDMSGIFKGLIFQVPTNYNPVTRTYDESTPWNGTFKLAYSNNPVWFLYWLITNTDYGLAHYYTNVAVNRGEFYEASKWCDEQVPSGVPGVTQPRFTFNEYIDSPKLGLELLMYIAGAFNSTIYDGGNGIIRLKTDRPRTAKQLFTPETVSTEGFTYTFTDITTRYNEVTVQFINPDLNWDMDERYASIDTSEWKEQNGVIPYGFVALGCTNLHEAIRRANDRVLTANTEVTSVTFDTARFGMLSELYDTILIADPVSGWSSGGRIKSYALGVIQLRDPLFVTAITACDLTVQTFSGLMTVQVVPPNTGLVYTLAVTGGTFPTNVPDRTQFTFENTTNIGLAKPFKITGIKEVSGNSDHYQITAIEINPDKYEDSANGTVSEPVTYDYTTPGESIMPIEIILENPNPEVSSDGTLIYRIHVSWVRPFQAYTDHYEIDYSQEGTGVWKTESPIYGEEVDLKPVKDGKNYEIRLFAVTPTGQRCRNPVIVSAWNVTKKNAILENVTGLTLNRGNKGWVASWNSPTNVPDLAGTRIKFSNPPKTWEELPSLYLSPSNEQDLPWFTAGTVRVHAKYINTSGNESEDSGTYDLSVLPPANPSVTVNTFFGGTQIIYADCTTTQPLLNMLVRVGNASSTWETASIKAFTIAANQNSFNVNPDATQATRVFLRGVDVAGNVGAAALIEIPAGANSVSELLDLVKGDIDETWITPGLLDHINFGDYSVPGSLANQITDIKATNGQFQAYVTWDFQKDQAAAANGWVFDRANVGYDSKGIYLSTIANDPIFYYSFNPTFKGSLYPLVRVRIMRLAGTGWDGTLYYANESHGWGSWYKNVAPDPTILNQWVTVEWDLNALTAGGTDWINSAAINSLRLDFGTVSGDNFLVQWVSVGRLAPGISEASYNNTVNTLANDTTAAVTRIENLRASVNAGSTNSIINSGFIDGQDGVQPGLYFPYTSGPDASHAPSSRILLTTNRGYQGDRFRVTPNEVLDCSIWAASDLAGKPARNVGMRGVAWNLDGSTVIDFPILTEFSTNSPALTISNVWQQCHASFIVPAGVGFIAPYYFVDQGFEPNAANITVALANPVINKRGGYSAVLTATITNINQTLVDQNAATATSLQTLTSVFHNQGIALNSDPSPRYPDQWEAGGEGGYFAFEGPVGPEYGWPAGRYAFHYSGAGGGSAQAKFGVPTKVGRRYRFSANVWRSSDSNGILYFRYSRKNADNSNVGGGIVTMGVEGISPPAGTWTIYSFELVADVNDAFVVPRIYLNWGATAGDMYAQDIKVEDITDIKNLTAIVQTESSTRADADGHLGGQWATRVSLDVNGQPVIGGIAIAGYSSETAGPTFDFSVRANKIAFLPPAGISSDVPSYPFVYYTTEQIIGPGVTVPPGLYTKNAFIEYITADQIDTRGLSVRAPDGTLVFGYNTPLTQAYLESGVQSKLNQGASAYADVNNTSTGLATRLKNNGNDVLGGVLSINVVTLPSGFRAGNLTWDVNGNRTGGYGVGVTPLGLVGYNSGGGLTFSINASTGAATFAGDISGSNGRFSGFVVGGNFNGYAWPASGGQGFYLGSEGLLLGNANDGRYFQVESSGNVYMPGLSVVNGSAVFGGTLTAAAITVAGTALFSPGYGASNNTQSIFNTMVSHLSSSTVNPGSTGTVAITVTCEFGFGFSGSTENTDATFYSPTFRLVRVVGGSGTVLAQWTPPLGGLIASRAITSFTYKDTPGGACYYQLHAANSSAPNASSYYKTILVQGINRS